MQKSPKKSQLSETEMWDRAFSEVMLSQQTQIATLLSEIEEAKQNADSLRSKYKHFDPNNTIPALRNQQEKLDQVVKQERENLIQEFQTTIRKLETDFQDGFSLQFTDYEHRIQALQVTIFIFIFKI
jgi:predicted  nucleic acid-binding Zn-ribbon protein